MTLNNEEWKEMDVLRIKIKAAGFGELQAEGKTDVAEADDG